MFKVKIEVCGHQYVVRTGDGSSDGPPPNMRADVFHSFDEMVYHLRCYLPIYPPLGLAAPQSDPPSSPHP